MRKSILAFAVALITSLSVSAQLPWLPVHTSGTGYYSIASTKNGNIYARKGLVTIVSTAGGAANTWTTLTTAPSSVPADIYANDKVLITLDWYNGAMRSLDYGATWRHANVGIIATDSLNLIGLVALDSTHWVLLHSDNGVNKVFVSGNNGQSWSGTLLMSLQNPISVLSNGGSTVWLITTGKVHKSTDWGGVWSDLGAVMPAGGAGKTVRLSDGSFLLRNSNGFFKSTNEGVSWTALSSSGIPAGAFAAQFIKSPASDTLYISTQTGSTIYGLYTSTDLGVTWSPFNSGLPANAKLNSTSFAAQLHIARNGYLFASPDSANIHRTTGPVTASTVVGPGLGIYDFANAEMNLQLSPNPAYDVLNLSFELKQPASCTMTVRNAFGQVMQTAEPVISDRKVHCQLDVSALAPGCYFVQISTPAGIAARPFIRR